MKKITVSCAVLLAIGLCAFQIVQPGYLAKITNYNQVALVANGLPIIVAKYDATAQQANIGTTTLYTVPAGQGGMYRIHAYCVLTQAATTSSTLPEVQVNWTDVDAGVQNGGSIVNPTASTANILGTTDNQGSGGIGTRVINATSGTNITISTVNYSSSGATPMQYAVHVKLEYLGN